MILDGHIHVMPGSGEYEAFRTRMKAGGIDGGIVVSAPPASFKVLAEPRPHQERLESVFLWTEGNPRLFPFYWIDPTEEDAITQVGAAVEAGVRGFKVICDRFFPGDERALPVFEEIARRGKPMLFHSGILWDGKASSKYNRPGEFEALLEVPGLRFAVAHISWPWCDECLAVYGKFLNARRRREGLTVEMFIDMTPGTPKCYRREVLTRLFAVGYDIKHNLMFGSDGRANNYDPEIVMQWVTRDKGIYADLGIENETVEDIFARNLLRFVGASE